MIAVSVVAVDDALRCTEREPGGRSNKANPATQATPANPATISTLRWTERGSGRMNGSVWSSSDGWRQLRSCRGSGAEG